MGVLPIVAVFWVIHYPVRLLTVQLNRNDPLLHPAMRRATDGDLTWVWLASTAGLAMLILGSWAIGRIRIVPTSHIDHLRRHGFTMVCVGGLSVAVVRLILGVSSGILSNVGPLALVGLGGLGFLDARRARTSWWTIAFVVIGLLVGALAGFKELAAMPAVAWGIGLIAGRRDSIRPRTVLAFVSVALFAYIGVAGQRIARSVGEPSDLPHAAFNMLTRYDLESGRVAQRGNRGWEILDNIASGLSRRTSGVEALVILREEVPRRVEYQHGRSLVLPILTVVPGSKSLTRDSPYSALSLGRYYDQNFYSARPQSDPSSQAITWAGDLYFNFGLNGILVGLFVIGAMLGAFDRRYPPTSAFNAGMLAYVGTQAIGMERNVAFVLVTTLLRLAIVSAVHAVLVGSLAQLDRTTATRSRRVRPSLRVPIGVGLSGARRHSSPPALMVAKVRRTAHRMEQGGVEAER
jgi:hypothetical protein